MKMLQKVPIVLFLIFKTFSICFADIALMVNVPMANNLFVGRDDYLTNMHTYLLKHNIITLYGSGGIGKTQIAKQYTYRYHNDYEIVWWIKSNEDLTKQIQLMIEKWNESASVENKIILSKQIEVDLKHLQEVIQSSQYHWLIILDDYDKNLIVLEKFVAQIAKMAQVKLILTNRDGTVILGDHKMNIKQFTRKESLEYLKQFSNPENRDDLISHQMLAELLSDYPLSIASAFAYIETLPITVKDYIGLYKSCVGDIKKIEGDVVSRLGKNYVDRYGMTLQTTVNISLEKISQDYPLAIEILKLMTLVDNKSIPEDLLLNYLSIDKVKYSEAIHILMAYGLIEYSDSKASFRCHDELHRAFNFYFDENELKYLLPKIIASINSLLSEDIFYLNVFIAKQRSFIKHIEKLYQHAQRFGFVNNELIRLKTKQLEFVLTNQRDKQAANKVINEITQLIAKLEDQKSKVDSLVKARFLLMQSTYTDWMLADYKLSTQQAKEAEYLIEQIHSQSINREKLMLATRLSQVYAYQGDYNKALIYVAKGEDIIAKDKSANIAFLTILMASKSIGYYHQGDFKKAADIEKTATESASSNDSNNMVYQKGNVFAIPLLLDKYRMMIKAKESLNESLTKLTEMEHDIISFYGEHNYFLNKLYFAKADCLFALGEFTEANIYIDKVLPHIQGDDISNAKINPIIVIQAIKLKGDILRSLGNYVEAESYYLYAERLSNKYFTYKAVQDISDLYISMVINKLDRYDIHGALAYKRKHDKLFGKQHSGYYKITLYLKEKSSDGQ
ncbi:NB-ARC domain-containing protein [Fastidiosibacter lacustris]|uniref:NB-ARC domain-containing protein n=1 Tax=Fastidiosibacter lacustris TaxID=2056695 RepID=UPI000E3487BA|nr:NB-ARC domain-containing protein [Fastidiosibacter lacustris]